MHHIGMAMPASHLTASNTFFASIIASGMWQPGDMHSKRQASPSLSLPRMYDRQQEGHTSS